MAYFTGASARNSLERANKQSRAIYSQREQRYYWITLLVLLSLASLFIGVTQVLIMQLPPPHVTKLTAPPASRMGMDYYHESMGYIRLTDAQLISDLQQIKHVMNQLKVYHNPYNAASLGYVMHIVRIAKARHMYVVWTENDDTTTLTDANWDEYSRAVIADAAQAASAGANEFLVGNEISLHNNGDHEYSDEQLPSRIKQLVMDCKTNFPGSKGYEDGWFKSDSWHRATLGPLDKIYFTLYEPWHTFKTEMDSIVSYFGKRAEIGELGTMTTEGQLHYSDQDWTRELMRRYDYARQKGITVWLFTFRETTNDGYGLFRFTPLNQAKGIWAYLEGRATITYQPILSVNFSKGTMGPFRGDGYMYNNRLRATAFNAPVLADVPISNYVFRGTAVPTISSGPETWRAMRLVVDYTNADNYYFIDIEPNGNKIQLLRRQNGIETNLESVTGQAQLGTKHDFEIRVSKNGGTTSIQVYWDTVKIIDIIDIEGRLATEGKVGMINNGIGGEIADVVITGIETMTGS